MPTSVDWTHICRIAVPFFVISLSVFTFRNLVSANSLPTYSSYAWLKTKRLYVPFIGWSLIYFALRSLKHQFIPGGSPIQISQSTLVTGTAHHLWFLPMALLVTFALLPASRLTRRSATWTWFLLTFGMGVGLMNYPLPVDAVENGWSYFGALTWRCLPAIFISLALARWLPSDPSPVLVRCAWIGVFVSAAWLFFLPYPPLIPCIGGVALFIGSHLTLPSKAASALRFLGATTFGVYLMHVAFVEGLQAMLSKTNWAASVAQDLTVATVAVAASVFFTLTARRFTKLRVLFP